MKAMNPLPKFPPAIYKYVRAAFRAANKRVCEKLVRIPNCPEQSLDMTLIDTLSGYAAPAAVAPGWLIDEADDGHRAVSDADSSVKTQAVARPRVARRTPKAYPCKFN
jgi:hypothetical protein